MFPLLLAPMWYGLLCGLWMWRRRTSCQSCSPPMSNPSTSSWTARPGGSGRWDNRMAAQHLPRDLVRPSSGQQKLAQTMKKIKLIYAQTWCLHSISIYQRNVMVCVCLPLKSCLQFKFKMKVLRYAKSENWLHAMDNWLHAMETRQHALPMLVCFFEPTK